MSYQRHSRSHWNWLIRFNTNNGSIYNEKAVLTWSYQLVANPTAISRLSIQ